MSAVSLTSEESGDKNKALAAKNSKRDMQAAKEENDRLLKTGMYSNANRWVAKIGVIIQ